jgi:hypothetical protein
MLLTVKYRPAYSDKHKATGNFIALHFHSLAVGWSLASHGTHDRSGSQPDSLLGKSLQFMIVAVVVVAVTDRWARPAL